MLTSHLHKQSNSIFMGGKVKLIDALNETNVSSIQPILQYLESEKIIEQVEVASQLLEGLSVDIYTPSLRQLKEASQDLQAVAKSSGAGGGDCGIALSFDAHSTEILKNRWADLGIELLYQERIGHDDKS